MANSDNIDTDDNNRSHDQNEEQSSVLHELSGKCSIEEYLTTKEIKYKVVSRNDHPVYLRAVMFKDDESPILVILPSDKILDYPALCISLNRDLELYEPKPDELPGTYDQALHSFPPLAEFLELKVLVDSSVHDLLKKESVVIPAGHNCKLISISSDDFRSMHIKIWHENLSKPILNSFTSYRVTEKDLKNLSKSFTLNRMKKRVTTTFEMPLIPPMADKLLELRVDPSAESTQLARLVEKDPSLAAQMISWACSPYYGYPGKITSIDDAIIKVLGYDLVMNIALGIAIGQVMKIDNEGPMGLENYWRHSIYSAALIEKIIIKMPPSIRPYRGLGYLCGLLHNFGFLVLGQLFPPQFYNLSQSIAINPHIPIIELEESLFGFNHQDLGAWLMESWHMPEELDMAVGHHHDKDYDQEHKIYVQLTYIANVLLAKDGIGDESCKELDHKMLEKLELSEEQLTTVYHEFEDKKNELEDFVRMLSS